METDKQREQVMEAFVKRACGYTSQEEVRELKDVKKDDGSVARELVVTKVTSKEVPPDLTAARWLLESRGGKETLTLDEARGLLLANDDEKEA